MEGGPTDDTDDAVERLTRYGEKPWPQSEGDVNNYEKAKRASGIVDNRTMPHARGGVAMTAGAGGGEGRLEKSAAAAREEREPRKDGGKAWNPGGTPGKLHREIGVPVGTKIPAKKLARAEKSGNPEIRRDAIRAKTMEGWRHG